MFKGNFVLLGATLIAVTSIFAASETSSRPVANFQEVSRAIRANDLLTLKQLVRTPADADVSDGLHNTLLHYAAMFGSADSVDILLSAGAAVDAQNSLGATPLQLAAWDLRRTRALVEHGAHINGTKGITPLMVACSMRGNTATVRYLVEKGADIQALSPNKVDALMTCAGTGETDAVAFLLAKGADVRRTDNAGFTALQQSTSIADQERIRILLAAGSDPNTKNSFAGKVKNGPIALVGMSTLMTVSPFGTPDEVRMLVKAGARVNDSDIRKMTPLMLSIATDQANPATVEALMQAGADVNAKDQNGESVLDWAHKFENPQIVSLLTVAGAKCQATKSRPSPDSSEQFPNVSQAIDRALPLLNRAGPGFFREGGGCSGCHHQSVFARAHAAAYSGAHAQDSVGKKVFLDSMLATRPLVMHTAPFLNGIPGDIDPPLYWLASFGDLGEPANDLTDTLVHYVVARQDASGAFVDLGISRPPLEDSTITRTAYAIQVLKLYSWPARQTEFTERIARAKRWLAQTSPKTTYEAAERLLGMQLAGATGDELRVDADRLIALQRADGGWAQTPYLESDAFATGIVLDALYKTGFGMPKDAVYARGTQFLLHTQFADGSWYVRSRAPKFQPYFQSGFPFNHDQWISSAGTAWALIALGHAAGQTTLAER